MSERIVERFVPFLTRLVFVFEPISPRFFSYFLNRKLREWKDKGLIVDYKTETRRIGKFHYKIDVNVALTLEQARNMLGNLVVKMFGRNRR